MNLGLTYDMTSFASLFCGWFGFWVVSHYLVQFIFEAMLAIFCFRSYNEPKGLGHRLKSLSGQRLSNFRRLLRCFLYCFLSIAFGFYLLLNYYHHYPDDLLLAWNDIHYIAFTMAVAHWTFSIFEDSWAGEEVHAHLELTPAKAANYRQSLYGHHIVTIFAYSWSLSTHYLSALCVFGLCFETPVIFIALREFLLCFDDVFDILRFTTFTHCRILWSCVHISWHLTRTVYCMHWPWSLIFWRPYLASIPIYSRIVYHTLGLVFGFVNYKILFEVLVGAIRDDMKRYGLSLKREAAPNGGNRYVVKHSNAIEEGSADLEMGSQKERTIVGKRLIGPKELALHCTRDDCWILIRGRVYDVTSFLESHPGGAQVLLEVAGTDASEAFAKANHSSKASHMMAKYEVAEMLLHGYDQTGVSPDAKKPTPGEQLAERLARREGEELKSRGDVTKPFRLFDSYFTWCDPMIPSVFLLSLFGWFVRSYVSELTKVLEKEKAHIRSPLTLDVLELNSSFSLVTKFLGLAAIFLIIFSAPVIQHSLLPTYGRFWIPESWTGQSSHLYRSLKAHPSLFLDIKVIFAAISCGIWMSALVYMWKLTVGFTIFRSALVVTSLAEFLLEFIVQIAVSGGGGIIGCLGRFGPISLLRYLVGTFDSAKYIGIWLLVISIVVEWYGFATSGLFPTNEPALKPIDSSALSTFTALLNPLTSNFFVIGIFAVSRVVYVHCLGLTIDRLSGDSYGAVTLITVISFMLLLVVCYFVGNVESLFPLVEPNASLLVQYSGLFVLGAFFSLVLLCFASFLWTTQAAYANHVFSLGSALFLWYVAPSVGEGRYWAFFWFFLSIQWLSRETSKRFEAMGTSAPAYWYRIKDIEGRTRFYITITLYNLTVVPLVILLSFFAPQGSTYWCPPAMIVDLGPKGEYGVAYLVNSQGEEQKPTVFQCNVGYMNGDGHDLTETIHSTRSMLTELIDDTESGKKGFVSDMVAVFKLNPNSPARKNGGYQFREINLSAWADEKSAYEWYKTSAAHKEIVHSYYNGGLDSFSALLAKLQAPVDAPIRWEVRCPACRKMVLGPKIAVCPYCSSAMPSLPYF